MRLLSEILCDEIRDCIINTVASNGGHLASNLGAVELTVALHYVFNSPDDAIVFDVGHQSYTHKLLTGRYNRFSSLRLEKGISEETYSHYQYVHVHDRQIPACGALRARISLVQHIESK